MRQRHVHALPAVFGAISLALSVSLLGCPADRLHSPTPKSPHQAPYPDATGTIELVESAPLETTLNHADVADASDVWRTMIDHAKATIDFAEFYASEAEPKDRAASKLTAIVDAIARAAVRGVKVRFLADSIFAPKYPDTLDALRRANVEVRILDVGALSGGVLHAKYFVVDGSDAFLGSQNFDWRALDHIQEMGVRVSSPRIAGALADVFDTDWQLAAGAPKTTRSTARGRGQLVPMARGEKVTFVASPQGWLPDEAEWDLPELVSMLDRAQRRIDLQLLTYKTKDRQGQPFHVLDDALRRASGRGVTVRFIVSEWATKPGESGGLAALEDLARLPHVELKVITIPKFSGGDIPFARVAHAKYLVVDAARAWVGTSNWEGDYFTRSRNVGVIVDGGKLPVRLDAFFEDNWQSAYVKRLEPPLKDALPRAAGAPAGDAGPP